jgi:hypothetical protein
MFQIFTQLITYQITFYIINKTKNIMCVCDCKVFNIGVCRSLFLFYILFKMTFFWHGKTKFKLVSNFENVCYIHDSIEGWDYECQFYWWRKHEHSEKNQWPVTSHWQTLSHNVVSSTPHHERNSDIVVVGTDCTGSCKS